MTCGLITVQKISGSRLPMKKIILLLMVLNLASTVCWAENGTYALTVHVADLRNSTGVLQFALYNQDGTIPDKKYTRYMRKQVAKIINGSSSITFTDLPEGVYAVNILHDENSNGKIDKGLLLPIEGIGFSNYSSIGMTHRPNFSGASFTLDSDMEIEVTVNYL